MEDGSPDLAECDLTECDLAECDLAECDLAELAECDLAECDLVECDLAECGIVENTTSANLTHTIIYLYNEKSKVLKRNYSLWMVEDGKILYLSVMSSFVYTHASTYTYNKKV